MTQPEKLIHIRSYIVNNAEKIEPLMTQMEQWSILSNVISYVQHSRFHSMNHTLDIKAVNKYKHKPNTDDREFRELDFGTTPQKLQEEYMDIYEGIHSEIVSSNRFDENSDLSTTYLGKVDKKDQHKLKAEESFPISEHGYTLGKLFKLHRMSTTIGHRCKQVLHVKIILYVMQVAPLFTKICFKNTENTSWIWPMC